MATFKGTRKTDDGDKYAKVVVVVGDLQRDKDQINVTIPQQSGGSLAISLNGRNVFNEPLPCDIIYSESTHKQAKLENRFPSRNHLPSRKVISLLEGLIQTDIG